VLTIVHCKWTTKKITISLHMDVLQLELVWNRFNQDCFLLLLLLLLLLLQFHYCHVYIIFFIELKLISIIIFIDIYMSTSKFQIINLHFYNLTVRDAFVVLHQPLIDLKINSLISLVSNVLQFILYSPNDVDLIMDAIIQ